ncbi:5676_t:CDS:2, partial [Funneliformis caledonium]
AQDYCELKDTFQKSKTYSYKPSALDILTKKISLFLLDYFKEIYKNRGKTTLKETVDSRCLSTEYSVNIVPLPDSYATLIEEENEAVEEVEANRSQEVHTEFINTLSHVNTW